jgi:sigma-E factor negative regulatory protein RseC
MIKEEGVVTRATNELAWIKTVMPRACEACGASDGCEVLQSKEDLNFTVANTLNVHEGDRVLVGLQTGSLFFLTFVLYILPILFLIAGAFIGNAVASFLAVDKMLSSMAAAGFSFALSLFLLKRMNDTVAGKWKHRPVLVKSFRKSAEM